jgi:hypothetical protein
MKIKGKKGCAGTLNPPLRVVSKNFEKMKGNLL